ncbi:conserved protein of unknown function [Tenacibaculum soleae]
MIPKTKNYITTTNSNHIYKKYKNLVKDQVPSRPEQLWVSDITYIKTEKGHNYLALVTDAYSKQIMGYKLDNHMRTSLCSDALAMAIKTENTLIKNLFTIQIEVSNTATPNTRSLLKIME